MGRPRKIFTKTTTDEAERPTTAATTASDDTPAASNDNSSESQAAIAAPAALTSSRHTDSSPVHQWRTTLATTSGILEQVRTTCMEAGAERERDGAVTMTSSEEGSEKRTAQPSSTPSLQVLQQQQHQQQERMVTSLAAPNPYGVAYPEKDARANLPVCVTNAAVTAEAVTARKTANVLFKAHCTAGPSTSHLAGPLMAVMQSCAAGCRCSHTSPSTATVTSDHEAVGRPVGFSGDDVLTGGKPGSAHTAPVIMTSDVQMGPVSADRQASLSSQSTSAVEAYGRRLSLPPGAMNSFTQRSASVCEGSAANLAWREFSAACPAQPLSTGSYGRGFTPAVSSPRPDYDFCGSLPPDRRPCGCQDYAGDSISMHPKPVDLTEDLTATPQTSAPATRQHTLNADVQQEVIDGDSNEALDLTVRSHRHSHQSAVDQPVCSSDTDNHSGGQSSGRAVKVPRRDQDGACDLSLRMPVSGFSGSQKQDHALDAGHLKRPVQGRHMEWTRAVEGDTGPTGHRADPHNERWSSWTRPNWARSSQGGGDPTRDEGGATPADNGEMKRYPSHLQTHPGPHGMQQWQTEWHHTSHRPSEPRGQSGSWPAHTSSAQDQYGPPAHARPYSDFGPRPEHHAAAQAPPFRSWRNKQQYDPYLDKEQMHRVNEVFVSVYTLMEGAEESGDNPWAASVSGKDPSSKERQLEELLRTDYQFSPQDVIEYWGGLSARCRHVAVGGEMPARYRCILDTMVAAYQDLISNSDNIKYESQETVRLQQSVSVLLSLADV